MIKLFEKVKINKERQINFLNIPIIQYGRKEIKNIEEKYLDILPLKSFKNRIFNRILNTLKEENITFDDIYLSRLNMGETYILAYIIKDWISKNNSKNPVVILTQKHHLEIFDLICPDIKCVYVPISKLEMDKTIFNILNIYKNKKILYWLPMQNNSALAANIKNQKTHFFEILCDFSGIPRKNDVAINIVTNCDIKQIAKKTGINLEKFVFISPDAISLTPLENSFWMNLVQKLNNKGFDVAYNSKEAKDVPNGAKHCFLSIKETYELASYAKAIISLRSGLNDVLSTINTKQFILYTDLYYHSIPAKDTLLGYSLKKLPFVNQDLIKEYNMQEINQDILINQIINEIEAVKEN